MGKMAKNGRFLTVLAIAVLGLWGLSQLAKPAYDPADHAGFSEEALAAHTAQINEARVLVDALDGNHPIFYATLADRASETGLHDLAYELAEMAVGDLVVHEYVREINSSYSQAYDIFYTCYRLGRIAVTNQAIEALMDQCIDKADELWLVWSASSPEQYIQVGGWDIIHERLYYYLNEVGYESASNRIARFVDSEILPYWQGEDVLIYVPYHASIVAREFGHPAAEVHCERLWQNVPDDWEPLELLREVYTRDFDCFEFAPDTVLQRYQTWGLQTRRSIEQMGEAETDLLDLTIIAQYQAYSGRELPVTLEVFGGDSCNNDMPISCFAEDLYQMPIVDQQAESPRRDGAELYGELLRLSLELDDTNTQRIIASYIEATAQYTLQFPHGYFPTEEDLEGGQTLAQIAEYEAMGYLLYDWSATDPEQAYEYLQTIPPDAYNLDWELARAVRRITTHLLNSNRPDEAVELFNTGYEWRLIEEEILPEDQLEASGSEYDDDDEDTFIISTAPADADPGVIAALVFAQAGRNDLVLEALQNTDYGYKSPQGSIISGHVLVMAGLMEEAEQHFGAALEEYSEDMCRYIPLNEANLTAFCETLIVVSLVQPTAPFESEVPKFGNPYHSGRWLGAALIPY